MIVHISGILISKKNKKIVVDASGIGYQITVSASAFADLGHENSQVKILTYQNFREDGVELFGFVSEFERELFMLLIGVSGIGPKTAIEILSHTSAHAFKTAIENQDLRTISSIKGIGKKTAEKLIFELKEKIKEFVPPGTPQPANYVDTEVAFDTLRGLGFSYNQAKEAISRASARFDGKQKVESTDLIRAALKELGK